MLHLNASIGKFTYGYHFEDDNGDVKYIELDYLDVPLAFSECNDISYKMYAIDVYYTDKDGYKEYSKTIRP